MEKDKLDFYTFGINNNDYFVTNVIKYINVKPNIKNIIYDANTNNNLKKELDSDTVFIISENKIDSSFYELESIPKYPIILFNKKYLIITSILLQQIGGIPLNMNISKMLLTILHNIKKYIGGVIIDDILKIKEYKCCDIYENNFGDTKFEKHSSVVKIVNKNSVKHFDNCYHGWLSISTQLNLKYAIHQFKPKNIVELGSWFGKSASYMIKLSPDSNYYFFDKFQNVCKSPYKIEKFNVLDKFYFTYQRFETFYKNITDINYTGDVYAIRKDAYESLNMLKKHDIKVDLIFIDFIKRTSDLIDFLKKCIDIYPNAVIVGDDYVFDSVKQALFEFMSQNKCYVGILPESYVMASVKLINYNNVYTDLKSSKYDKKDQNYDYDNVKKILSNGNFDDVLEYIKNNKLDMNKKYYSNENTIYHILCEILFKINKKELLEKFIIYQKPEKIENTLLLTYNDYLNNNINFS
jgi:hypothetical protein